MRLFRNITILIWAITAFFGITGQALLYAEPIQLETIVVSAPQEEDADEKRIENTTLKTYKIIDLAEILADEMIEATMIRKGGYGNDVALRGFGQSNLRVLVDDSILEGACGSRKDPSLSHINMLTVDKIETKQGPFDVTKAGALGGSINVNTKKPMQEFHGEIMPKVGSYGFVSGGFYATGGNDMVQGLVGYNYSESDQYEDGDGNRLWSFAPGGRPYTFDGRNMNAYEKNDVWAKIQLTPTSNQTFLFSHTYGRGEDIMAPRVGMDIKTETTSLTQMDYVLTDLGEFSEKLSFSIYQNKVEHTPYDKYRELVGAPFFHMHNEVESIITGGKIENRQSTDLALVTYGIDMYKRNWEGDMYRDDTGALFNDELIPDVDTYNYGMYLKADKDINKWTLAAGLRYDNLETRANESLKQSLAAGITTNKRKNDLLGGYLSTKYYITDNSSLFGGVGYSSRPPTSVERYLQSPSPYFHGNPDLDPVRNTELDFGLQVTGRKFSLRVKTFYSDLDDYIYQQGKQTAASHQTWVNIDAHIYGIDTRAIVDIMENLSVEAAFAYQRGEKDSYPEANTDNDLAQIAPLKTKIALHYNYEDLSGTLEWIHSEKSDHVDKDAGETELSGWDVVNFRAGYNYRRLIFNVGINNILDKQYAVANSYEWDVVSGSGANPAVVSEPGRFFFASCAYKF